MSNHATIFFCSGYGYLMCYDNDLEKLPAPNKRFIPPHRFKPFQLVEYDSGRSDKTWVIRVIYKPEETDRGRRPDDMVDMFAVVTADWLKRMAWQFESTYPGGLDDDMLLKSRNVEILY